MLHFIRNASNGLSISFGCINHFTAKKHIGLLILVLALTGCKSDSTDTGPIVATNPAACVMSVLPIAPILGTKPRSAIAIFSILAKISKTG